MTKSDALMIVIGMALMVWFGLWIGIQIGQGIECENIRFRIIECD